MAKPDIITPGHVPPAAYPRFVESVTDYAVFFLDREGRVSSWNPGAERINGYRADEIIGKHVSVFYPESDVMARKPQYELRVATAEGRFQEEGWRIRKDGTMFWSNIVTTALKAPDGTLLGFAKVTRDMTARKHAEEALRQSEERSRLLIESVKDYAIFVLDESGRIRSWNEGARRLKGYAPEEIIGEHFSKFYRQEDIDRGHPQHELEIAVAEGRYEEEGWRIRKDGTQFWASVTITALRDSTGRHVGFAKVTRDLTARKKAEDELRERARTMAVINRELDAFGHTVAHDLRSPIRAVEHLSSLLLEEESDRLSEDGKISLRALNTTARNMARLVQDLLELSLANARAPSRAKVDLTKLARALADELVRVHPERTMEFHIQDGMEVEADRDLLRIAMTNLLSNASKFSRERKPAIIEVGQDGEAFYVRDNGAGFDPAKYSLLFQPFARLHDTNQFEGTGIGLSTVARIVRRHGGRIWATSTPDHGATFYFTLHEERP